MELAQIPGMAVPPTSADPWFAWLAYFTENKAVDFAPRSRAAADRLLTLFADGINGDRESQAGVLLLAAQVLARQSDERSQLAPTFLAHWLDRSALQKAIKGAHELGKSEHHYINCNDNLPFWTFLHASRIERANGIQKVVVDPREVVRRLTLFLSIGLAADGDEIQHEAAATFEVPVQALYRAWDVRDTELEKVRPFFGEETLRAKIRPLQVAIKPSRPITEKEVGSTSTVRSELRPRLHLDSGPRKRD